MGLWDATEKKEASHLWDNFYHNGQVEELLTALLLPRELASVKPKTQAKRKNIKAKEKSLSDDYSKQANFTKVRILYNPLKGKSLEGFKQAIRQYICIAPYFQKEKWELSDCSLLLDNSCDYKMVFGGTRCFQMHLN